MMLAVTEHPSGTAFRAMAGLRANRIFTAGKTGTAQFALGQNPRVDSWFIGFAPFEQPQIAYAVVVEGGGYGSQTAAPIAAAIVEKYILSSKSEIRNPKSETNSNDQSTKSQTGRRLLGRHARAGMFGAFGFRILNLFRISCLGFRIF
jgi:membrane peptidoglycan carboxypeptidase